MSTNFKKYIPCADAQQYCAHLTARERKLQKYSVIYIGGYYYLTRLSTSPDKCFGVHYDSVDMACHAAWEYSTGKSFVYQG